MAFDYDQLADLKRCDELCTYTDRDALHYALSIGMGRDPMDNNELPFVTELFDEKTVPTLATVLGPQFFRLDVKGLNGTGGVHGEQFLTIHKPLPRAAEILVDSEILDVFDKGISGHAVIYGEQDARLKDTNEPLFTLRYNLVLFGAGGFGGHKEGAPEAHPIPHRAPNVTCELPTSENQALVYALNGDRIDLHRNPAVSAAQRYPRPIMHGLCSYGIACHAVLKSMCAYDHAAIKEFNVRFSAPAFPGETYLVDMWRDGNTVSFCAHTKERGVTVLNNGKCVLS